MENLSPAPYSTTDTAETLAVDTFSNLVDPDKVKLDIKTRDKYPNIDGYVELVDNFRVPMGKLEVQIKKLPDTFDPNNPKVKIEKSLLAHSKTVTSNPVLYIGVDIHNDSFYWVYIHDKLTNTRGEHLIDFLGESTLIPLDLSNIDNGIVKDDEDDYFSSWEALSQKHKNSTHDYDNLKEQFHELEMHSEPTLGEYADEFEDIHIFLDELNDKLGYFDIIKHRFYFKDTWKLGLAYEFFSDTQLIYTLFPIPYNKNDVQIKKIEDINGLRKFRDIITHHVYDNPIKTNPTEHAKEIIKGNIEKILKNRLLNHCNEFIATELVFAVLDASYGFKDDSCSLEDIKSILERGVVNKYKRYDFQPHSFLEAVSFLESKNKKTINRIYTPKDYERNREEAWIWNSLSFNSAKKNLELIFENLLPVYEDILSCNFSRIELPFFKGASKVIFAYSLKDKYTDLMDHPRLNTFYLKSDETEDFEIKVYDMEQESLIQNIFESIKNDDNVEIGDNLYKVFSYTLSMADFIYEDTPMLNYIYSTLNENFKIFFKSWKK